MRTRSILTAAGIAAAIALGSIASGSASHHPQHVDGHHERGPLDIWRAEISQSRGRLTVDVGTADRWASGALKSNPEIRPNIPQDYLCLELLQRTNQRRYCLTRHSSGPSIMLGGHINSHGNVGTVQRLPTSSVDRHDMRSATISFGFGAIGLHPGQFRWRLVSGWGDPTCAPDLPETARRVRPCDDRAPNHLFYKRDIIQPHVVGCTRDEDMFNTQGPSGGKEIALTFDDGPSSYTGQVIDILNHAHVNSTFFLIGQEIPGHETVMRRALASGHELGNHSMHHETNGASWSSLQETNARIKAATGFEPCLYRPPGGYISASTSRAAWSMGMSNIIWDVDPTDWQTPGSGAIYSRVVSHAHSGSIVLMHDGGGNRSQTVAALPAIISTLKGRGYHLVTVSQLLGEHARWVP